MIGLRGARVIVVDDDEKEAMPILKAFSKKGISTAFFDGTLRSLPAKSSRLSGVRLAILDMDLIGGRVDERSKASALVKYLENILNPENGPYVMLVWTNHPELKDLVENYLFSDKAIPTPILTMMVTKAECKNRRGNFNLAQISSKLDDALKQFSPLLLMQAWEGKCFKAATDVTNALSGLAIGNADDLTKWRDFWKANLLQIMCSMAKAERGQTLDADSCLFSLYGSLNPLHADRMESEISKLSGVFRNKSNEILSASRDFDVKSKAKVNSMMHLAFQNLEFFAAGNMYIFPSNRKPKWLPSGYQLLEDFAQRQATPEETARKISEISDVSIPALIEASAVCDHAQKNIRIARFIFGLIVPVSERKKLNVRAGFIWEFGPISLEKKIAPSGVYYFYFSARHMLTLDIRQAVKLKAIARLRGEAFADLQAWFASHATRPGIMLLRQK